ncbi:MAG: hypothetical protein WBB45_18360 [Cyclobacteriaceae bacterium]
MIELFYIDKINSSLIRGGKKPETDPYAQTAKTDGGTVVTEPPIREGEEEDPNN